MSLIPRMVEAGATFFIGIARRLDPLYRDAFDQRFRQPIERMTQRLIRRRLKDEGLAIGEELVKPGEARITQDITETMNRFLVKEYRQTGKTAERAGNTKTYGLVRATLTVKPNLPKRLQVGLFKPGRSYPAYVRFGGPGPRVVPDIQDNGILSIGIKLMGVPGRKLLDDEQHTVDFSGISSPSFTTPNVQENVKLQHQIARGTPSWYFLNPLDSHYLDMIMQGLYARTHANPLELAYYSCVPYRYGRENGHERAIKYALIPRLSKRSEVGPLTDNYLREAMIATLAKTAVTFDFAIQFQKDPVAMPIEDASVVWPESLSPFITIATLDIPKQRFDYPAQDAFARNLTINPWHTLPVHRPLGNQNRARKTVYLSTSRMRQAINDEPHLEPTGDEQFAPTATTPAPTPATAPDTTSASTSATAPVTTAAGPATADEAVSEAMNATGQHLH
ncbi:hypothetical protein [Marinobacter caseinilyticus]|uniref:hypothetical protein n=1 Tax=Marinobacter caseinilyticus TaxID=2692195 RepID=UPI001A949BBD|nr:hypothetical protein [Marinobacter caseinilyticus]